jgi:hypothetical protein
VLDYGWVISTRFSFYFLLQTGFFVRMGYSIYTLLRNPGEDERDSGMILKSIALSSSARIQAGSSINGVP